MAAVFREALQPLRTRPTYRLRRLTSVILSALLASLATFSGLASSAGKPARQQGLELCGNSVLSPVCVVGNDDARRRTLGCRQ
jgi:hypothetical protein